MTKDEYMEFHRECCERMQTICKAKNSDYTGLDPSPFANFIRVEDMGVASTEAGFMVRMLDKYCRINSFVQKGILDVKDESIEDTLLDLANYSILLMGYIRSKKEERRGKERYSGSESPQIGATIRAARESTGGVGNRRVRLGGSAHTKDAPDAGDVKAGS